MHVCEEKRETAVMCNLCYFDCLHRRLDLRHVVGFPEVVRQRAGHVEAVAVAPPHADASADAV